MDVFEGKFYRRINIVKNGVTRLDIKEYALMGGLVGLLIELFFLLKFDEKYCSGLNSCVY
jgi:hypothetical protein